MTEYSVIIQNQKYIIQLLEGRKTKSTIDRILEDGLEILRVDDVSKGAGNNLQREVITYAVRQHTNTPLRYLAAIWGYSTESSIYQIYSRANDKALGKDEEFIILYNNLCVGLGI